MNIMLDLSGYPKLVDLGLAKSLAVGERTYSTVGTPHYMCPEAIQGKGYSYSCDIWALAVMLYELLYGFLPWGEELEDPFQVCKAVLSKKLVFPVECETVISNSAQDLLTKMLVRQ
jgi:cGMP-dependent protein kinase